MKSRLAGSLFESNFDEFSEVRETKSGRVLFTIRSLTSIKVILSPTGNYKDLSFTVRGKPYRGYMVFDLESNGEFEFNRGNSNILDGVSTASINAQESCVKAITPHLDLFASKHYEMFQSSDMAETQKELDRLISKKESLQSQIDSIDAKILQLRGKLK